MLITKNNFSSCYLNSVNDDTSDSDTSCDHDTSSDNDTSDSDTSDK